MHGSLLSVRFKYHSATILLADLIACILSWKKYGEGSQYNIICIIICYYEGLDYVWTFERHFDSRTSCEFA